LDLGGSWVHFLSQFSRIFLLLCFSLADEAQVLEATHVHSRTPTESFNLDFVAAHYEISPGHRHISFDAIELFAGLCHFSLWNSGRF
jgi:hypothetical protein